MGNFKTGTGGSHMPSFALVIPTLNAEPDFARLLPSLSRQTVKPNRFIVLDSESADRTQALAADAGAEVVPIRRADFNHGGTRMVGAHLVEGCDVVVYMTQDASFAESDSLEKILTNFRAPDVAAVYGRQLPRPESDSIEAFARLFNYPAQSLTYTLADRDYLGFKLIFFSNSFAAYRRSELLRIGGFRSDTIFGEDTLAIADLIRGGGRIAYDAMATVYHSHSYTLTQEFKRYFDIGVMHSRERKALSIVGSASSRGWAYLRSEMAYLARTSPQDIPEAIIRTALKYLGYRLGKIESALSLGWKRKLSMSPRYWRDPR